MDNIRTKLTTGQLEVARDVLFEMIGQSIDSEFNRHAETVKTKINQWLNDRYEDNIRKNN